MSWSRPEVGTFVSLVRIRISSPAQSLPRADPAGSEGWELDGEPGGARGLVDNLHVGPAEVRDRVLNKCDFDFCFGILVEGVADIADGGHVRVKRGKCGLCDGS